MTKRKELERELLVSGSGFCKRLSVKELYAESRVWRVIRTLAEQLTANWDTDTDGKSVWDPKYYLNDIRHQCIKVLYCRNEEDLESIFSNICFSFNFGIKIKNSGVVSVNMFLTWVALKYIKEPSMFVKTFIKGLENFFFYNRFKVFSVEKEKMFTKEELEVYCQQVEIIYNNTELLKKRIRKDKEQGISLKIAPSLASPQKIYGDWTKVTRYFDLVRIGEILTLCNKDSERVILLKKIKSCCEIWDTDIEEERIQKVAFLDELIKVLMRGTSIALLCRLQEQNMQSRGQLMTLQNNMEQKDIDYVSKNLEMQKRITELDMQVKEQDKTIRRQDGYINSLEKGGNSKKRGTKNHKFQHCITFPEQAAYIIRRLHELVDCQTSPKQIVMPLRAAMDAGIIRQPTWPEFCEEFGPTKISSKSSLSKYLKDDYRFIGVAFNLLVKEFDTYKSRS